MPRTVIGRVISRQIIRGGVKSYGTFTPWEEVATDGAKVGSFSFESLRILDANGQQLELRFTGVVLNAQFVALNPRDQVELVYEDSTIIRLKNLTTRAEYAGYAEKSHASGCGCATTTTYVPIAALLASIAWLWTSARVRGVESQAKSRQVV